MADNKISQAKPANQKRGGYRRGGHFRGNGNGGYQGGGKKRGLFQAFFGFTGAISKEFYFGATIILELITLCIMGLQMFIPEGAAETGPLGSQIAYYTLGALLLAVFVSSLSYGYRRAHALGISGFYSLAGSTFFLPFFAFYKSDRDGANDGAYAYQFTKFKALGGFLGKNLFIQIVIVSLIFGVILGTNFAASGEAFNQYQNWILGVYMFNLLQIALISGKFSVVRRWYTNAVKVVSFFAYNAVVIWITATVVAQAVLSFVLKSLQK